jgi:DmsE family decaheme c-type cytochrome
VLSLGAALALPGAPARQDKGDKQAKQAAPPKGAYAGSEACAACHAEVSTAFARNPHHRIETGKRRGWEGRACEACHGPGEKHTETNAAADILNPAKLPPKRVDAMCLACHKNQPTQVGRLQSGHARNSVACTACHNVHKTGRESSAYILKTNVGVNKTCTGCHTNVWAQFQRPHRHPLPEGAMNCVSCHNPHSAFLNRNLRLAHGAQEVGCIQCHSDKRGPFLFDHAPVQAEPCTICHEVHGSANPRMLTRHEVSFVCLECHANLISPSPAGTLGGIPTAIHDMRNPRFRNCTMCHQKIHGSNADRSLLR